MPIPRDECRPIRVKSEPCWSRWFSSVLLWQLLSLPWICIIQRILFRSPSAWFRGGRPLLGTDRFADISLHFSQQSVIVHNSGEQRQHALRVECAGYNAVVVLQMQFAELDRQSYSSAHHCGTAGLVRAVTRNVIQRVTTRTSHLLAQRSDSLLQRAH